MTTKLLLLLADNIGGITVIPLFGRYAIMKTRPLFFYILALLFWGCQSTNEKGSISNEPIDSTTCVLERLTIAKGNCYGYCPHEAIIIQSNQTAFYFAGEHSDSTGYFSLKITKEQWGYICTSLHDLNVSSLKEEFNGNEDDQEIEIIVQYSDTTIKSIGTMSGFPNGYASFLEKVFDIVESSNLQKIDSIHFDTKIQFDSYNIPSPIKKINDSI